MKFTDALRDPQLFGPYFGGESWKAWHAAMAALHGEPMDDELLEIYQQCTARETAPTTPFHEAFLICSRRVGKTHMAAPNAIFFAAFRDYSDVLSPGEIGVVSITAADHRQARVMFRYCEALVDAIPMLSRMVTARTRESITFNNRTAIEVHTCSYRSIRGQTIVAAICDEVAFWRSDESANPDVEVLAALRPAMATIPNPLLLCISSPHQRSGVLFDAYRRYWGDDTADVLVWKADAKTMNPLLSDKVIERAYAADPQRAAAEFGGEFRADLEAYVSTEAIRAVTVRDRVELPPDVTTEHTAFVDPSGGAGQDSFAMAISHLEGETVVLDCIREAKPPFSPEAVVAAFAVDLERYRCRTVIGDRFGGSWVAERFARFGIEYETAPKTRSELYLELLPLIMGGRVQLLDHQRLHAQLVGLERRTGRTGKDAIDHPRNSHDDLANAAAGALVLAEEGQQSTMTIGRLRGV